MTREIHSKKIIVIGCPGSGKTTFAEKLEKKTKLPLFYLDAIWHKADKTHISRDEFDERLSNILACESYIIDGNYSRTLERRIAACDTVFFYLICQRKLVLTEQLLELEKSEAICRGLIMSLTQD